MASISYPGCAHGGQATPFHLQDTEDTRLRVHDVHQNGLTVCDTRYWAPKNRDRPDGDEMKCCCSALSAREYVPANGTVVGLAVLGEESGRDLE